MKFRPTVGFLISPEILSRSNFSGKQVHYGRSVAVGGDSTDLLSQILFQREALRSQPVKMGVLMDKVEWIVRVNQEDTWEGMALRNKRPMIPRHENNILSESTAKSQNIN